jgi:putative aldouronate transport system permease protein
MKKRKRTLFDFIVILICALSILLCIFPFFNVIAISLSSNNMILANKVYLWPQEFTTDAYHTVFYDPTTFHSFLLTVTLTAVYFVFSMAMTICCAYPLSRKNLMGRKYIMTFVIFTMYFSGGLIPTYLLLKQLGLINTFWVMVLPGMLNTFNMIILRTFFVNGIPDSLVEAAQVEGCGELRILMQIVLPLSKPVLATLSLFYIVARWNGFSDALYYVSSSNLYPLQYRLYQIINSNMATDTSLLENINQATINPESIKSASIIVTVTPILLVYPFLQKYFVKGVMIGSVKG